MSKTEIKCDRCNYTTGRKFNMDRHNKKHEAKIELCKIMSYRCPICTYSTDRKYNFTRHEAKHKRIKRDKLHRCFLCDYNSKSKSNVSKHVNNHHNRIKLKMARLRGLKNRWQGRLNRPTVERFDKDGNIIKVTTDYESLLEEVMKEFEVIKQEHYRFISTNEKDRIITTLVDRETDIYSQTSTEDIHSDSDSDDSDDSNDSNSDYDYKDTETDPEDRDSYQNRVLEIIKIRGQIKKLKRLIHDTEDEDLTDQYQKELNNLLCKMI